MTKNFVLDTNVLLHDPHAIFHFADNTVVIPIFVLEEIDQFKKELSELGRNAREVARTLDRFRQNGAHLSSGIDLESGGRVSGVESIPAGSVTASCEIRCSRRPGLSWISPCWAGFRTGRLVLPAGRCPGLPTRLG